MMAAVEPVTQQALAAGQSTSLEGSCRTAGDPSSSSSSFLLPASPAAVHRHTSLAPRAEQHQEAHGARSSVRREATAHRPTRRKTYKSLARREEEEGSSSRHMTSTVWTLLGADELRGGGSWSLWRAVLTEYAATLVLLTVCLALGLPSSTMPVAPPVLETALGGGCTVAAAVQMSIHVSGAHLNPAVTVAFVAVGTAKAVRGLLYVAAQCAAGVSAAALLTLLLPAELQHGLSVIAPDPALAPSQVFAIEALVTALLLLVACAVGDPEAKVSKGIEPVTIALTVVACQVFSIKYTGCGLNPARVLGPAVIMNRWDHQWEYWGGEIVGGLIGALLYVHVVSRSCVKRRHSKSHSIVVVSEHKDITGTRIIRREFQ